MYIYIYYFKNCKLLGLEYYRIKLDNFLKDQKKTMFMYVQVGPLDMSWAP